MKYNIVIEKINKSGIVDREEIHNSMNSTGLKVLMQWMMNYEADGSRGFKYIEFLNGSTSISNIAGSVNKSQTSYTVESTYENTGSSSVTIDNAKLNDGNTSDVLAQSSFTAYTLDNGEKLKITWTISFS